MRAKHIQESLSFQEPGEGDSYSKMGIGRHRSKEALIEWYIKKFEAFGIDVHEDPDRKDWGDHTKTFHLRHYDMGFKYDPTQPGDKKWFIYGMWDGADHYRDDDEMMTIMIKQNWNSGKYNWRKDKRSDASKNLKKEIGKLQKEIKTAERWIKFLEK